MKLAKISIKRPTVVVVSFFVLILFGILSYMQLSQELFPKTSAQTIMVGTIYPGAGANEVENSVTKKIEDALSSLEGVKEISSTSMESFSVVVIKLKYGVPVDKVIQDAQRKVNTIKSELPPDIKEPAIDKFDDSQLPILYIGATSNMPDMEFYDFLKYTIKPSFERVTGVGIVELIGGNEREIQVNLDENRLKAYGLSILQVTETLIASNLDFPTGKVKDNNSQIVIRLSGKYQTLNDIENVVVAVSPDGAIITVANLAEVRETKREVTTINRIDGQPSVGITITRQNDANSVNITKDILKILEVHEKDFAHNNLTFNLAQNESEFTIESTNSVLFDLLLAVLFVAFVMVLFLQSWRNSLIVIVAIPTSLITTFIAMYLLGFTLNIASLLSLSLVIGILVDDAIVVVENIHRHLEMGKNRIQAAYDGVKEIGLTVFSITMVLVVVFIPVSLTDSNVSELFRNFCITAAAATLLSLLVSFTIVPLMSSRIGKLENIRANSLLGRFTNRFEGIINRMADGVRSLLAWSFSHKLIVFTITITLFIGSISLIPLGFIGTEFMSVGDRGEFYIDIELPKNSTIEQTNQLAFQSEEIIRRHPLVSTIFTTVGASEDSRAQSYLAEILVRVVPHKDRKKSTDEIAQEIRMAIQREVVGAKITTSLNGLSGGKMLPPIEVVISGNDLTKVLQAGDKVLTEMQGIKGMMDAKSSIQQGNTEINITPDRKKMAKLGITMEMLGHSLNIGFSGNNDAKFRGEENEYDINIRLDELYRKDMRDLADFSVLNGFGQPVKLSQFAMIEESEGNSKLQRFNRMPSVTLTSLVSGRALGDVSADLFSAINRLELPETINIHYAGDIENQDEGFGTLGFAVLISILLVYLIMVVLYNNYIYPLAVMFSIPLALIGALVALAMSMEYLNMVSMMGMIMLIGLVAKNAILVVDFANQLQDEGKEVKDALLEATQKRFRPILMTAISTIIGMLPIALATGAGADWKNGLAWVLIGGLISATLLTLVIVPLVYYLLFRLMTKLGWKKKKETVIID